MKSIFAYSKAILLAFCFILTPAALAAAQGSDSLPAPETPAKKDKYAEKTEAANKFYELTKLAPAALADGDLEKAESYSQKLLKDAENFPKDWNYGNAIHVGNLVLGHIALANGDLAEAKNFLPAAGKTPGSPQLDSFGPNMLLAKALLEKGESAVVLEYFDLCANFWKSETSHLNEWKETVKRNEIPDFRANLLYYFNSKGR